MKQAYMSLFLLVFALAGCSETRDPGPAPATTRKPNPPIQTSQSAEATPPTKPEQPRFNGTPVKITVHDPGREDLSKAVRNARAAFETVERLASSRSPYYELTSSKDNPDAFSVSAETLRVVERAVFWTQRSGGAYNCVKGGKPEDVKLGLTQRQVRLKPGCELDVSALVIGAAVDAAVRQLKQARIRCAEIEAGPVHYLMGKKEGAKAPEKLLVEIRHPKRKGKVLGSLGTLDNAVVHLADTGKYRGPKVDPRDGSPVSRCPGSGSHLVRHGPGRGPQPDRTSAIQRGAHVFTDAGQAEGTANDDHSRHAVRDEVEGKTTGRKLMLDARILLLPHCVQDQSSPQSKQASQ